MGRAPTHQTFHLGNLPGPAPDCDGLVRSLNVRLDNVWKPVAKWCDRCQMMWRFDPDLGVQAQEPPKLQEQEKDWGDEPDTWYEVWVADDPGDNFTAVCRVCGWRSAIHKDEHELEKEVEQHGDDTDVDIIDEDGEVTQASHLTGMLTPQPGRSWSPTGRPDPV